MRAAIVAGATPLLFSRVSKDTNRHTWGPKFDLDPSINHDFNLEPDLDLDV